MNNKLGKQTFLFKNKPIISGACSVVGTKEGEGPLKSWFDIILEENMYGEKTWEKAESKMLKEAVLGAIQKSGLSKDQVDLMMCGDLLNQLMSSSFMARDLHIPFIGLYGACSTMAQALLLGSVLVDGGYGTNIVAGASSHYCTAERQFRLPLEHGNQRPLSAQWTTTAAGAAVISSKPNGCNNVLVPPQNNIYVTHGTIGKIIDTGMKDANQMGAAMAPAAVDTMLNHFEDTKRGPDDYDIILTGDLGYIGKEIAKDLLKDAGISAAIIESKYDDCGSMIFDKDQDVHGGASGCGCSASVYTGYLFKKMRKGDFKRALIISTGAMLSTISPYQGESIPGIAHGVSVEACLG